MSTIKAYKIRCFPTEEQKEFLKTKRTLTDFKKGLKITGKLMPKRRKHLAVAVGTGIKHYMIILNITKRTKRAKLILLLFTKKNLNG